MRWIKLDNKEKILRIITYLVLNRIEVMILIQGSVFTSTFIKMSGEDISSTMVGDLNLFLRGWSQRKEMPLFRRSPRCISSFQSRRIPFGVG